MPTITEIARVSGNPFLQGLILAVQDATPLLTSFDTREFVGTRFTSLALAQLGTGEFLDINQGYKSETVPLAVGEFEAARVGIAVSFRESSAQLWDQENSRAIGARLQYDYLTLQTIAKVRGALRHVERQIIQGRSNDAKGFPGLKELTPSAAANTLTLGDDPSADGYTKSAINVGGSAASKGSSIYSVCFGAEDAQLLMGGPQGVEGFLRMDPPTRVWKTDPEDSTREQWHIVTKGEGYVGLSVMGSNEDADKRRFAQFSVRRAFNVTTDAGKGCTDEVLAYMYDCHPEGHKPNAFYMSHRSLAQLRASRSGTSATIILNNGIPLSPAFTPTAPVPEYFRGIPIIATDAIGSTDSIETPA